MNPFSLDIRPRAGSFNESDLSSNNNNNIRLKYQQQQKQQQQNRGGGSAGGFHRGHSTDLYNMQPYGSSYPPPTASRYHPHNNNSNNTVYDPLATSDHQGSGYDHCDSSSSASLSAAIPIYSGSNAATNMLPPLSRRRPRRESFGSGRSSPTSSLESASARSGSSSSLASSMMTLTSVDSRYMRPTFSWFSSNYYSIMDY